MINPGKQKNAPAGLRGVPLCRTQIKQDSCHYLAAGWEINFFYFITIDCGLLFSGMSKKTQAPMGIAVPWY